MKLVKSAERTMAILEYLSQSRPSTVGEISGGLGLPNSSTSMLLKTLVAMGYLIYSPDSRVFRPSYRVALLGESVDEQPLLRDEPLVEKLRALHKDTGETVVTALQNGAYVQYVYVIPSANNLMAQVPVGKMRLMAYNPLGEALLASLDDKRITSIFRHNNANWPDPSRCLTERVLWDKIKQVRASGYCEGSDQAWPGTNMIAVAIRLRADMPRVSVAIGGRINSIGPQRDKIISSLRALR
jgi:DNA-binding IclR family transcriptional regulator